LYAQTCVIHSQVAILHVYVSGVLGVAICVAGFHV
jgi:hypothetical protein